MVDLHSNNSLVAAQQYRSEYALRRSVESEETRRKKAPAEFRNSEPQKQSEGGQQRTQARAEDVVDLSPSAAQANKAQEKAETHARIAADRPVGLKPFSGDATPNDQRSVASLREAPIRPTYVPPGSKLDLTI